MMWNGSWPERKIKKKKEHREFKGKYTVKRPTTGFLTNESFLVQWIFWCRKIINLQNLNKEIREITGRETVESKKTWLELERIWRGWRLLLANQGWTLMSAGRLTGSCRVFPIVFGWWMLVADMRLHYFQK